jgi:hypothetical protein
LPNLSIRQSGESLCQHGWDQHGGGEPLHSVAGAQAPPLLVDEFPDRHSPSPACSVRSGWENCPEGLTLLPKTFLRNGLNPAIPAGFSVSCEREQ